MFRLRNFVVLILAGGLILNPPYASGAQIDEIAYFTNKALKELSRYVVSIVTSPQLGTCGRRRELKITGRKPVETWSAVIESALRRDSKSRKSIQVSPVTNSVSGVDSAITHLLGRTGFSSEVPQEEESLLRDFKKFFRTQRAHLTIYKGSARNVDSSSSFNFLALADLKNDEVLLVGIGDEFCR